MNKVNATYVGGLGLWVLAEEAFRHLLGELFSLLFSLVYGVLEPYVSLFCEWLMVVVALMQEFFHTVSWWCIWFWVDVMSWIFC